MLVKRLTLLVAAALLALHVTAGPVAAEFVPATTSRAVCMYGNPAPGWDLFSYHTLHYGSAHVTQCWYRYFSGGTWCSQYVWNVPNPHWEAFPPRQVGTNTYICW